MTRTLALALLASASIATAQSVETRPPNAANQTPANPQQTRAPERKANVAFDVVPVVEGLQNPWGMALLPGNEILVTEKPGRMRIVRANGQLSAPIAGLPAVDARGQGGLLDVTLDPAFATNRLVYWSYSEPRDSMMNNTAVARGRLVDGDAPRLENVQVIFHQAPAMRSTMHYGSRIVFARDGKLFVTMGDRSIIPGRMQAQNMDGLIGKIARINPDGTIPPDNPFVGRADARPEIWSIGHRNVQAATLHPTTGELWEVEHGTQGGDEINIARKGKDYGWPTIAYGIEYRGGPITGGITAKEGMEQPVYYWDPVIAPGSMLFYTGDAFPAWKGSLFVGGLNTRYVARLTLDGEKVVGEERILADLQLRPRFRGLHQAPDGSILFLSDVAQGGIYRIVPRR